MCHSIRTQQNEQNWKMCVVTGHIECVYLPNINFSILQQFKQESPVFLKIVGLHTLGTGCDAKGE